MMPTPGLILPSRDLVLPPGFILPDAPLNAMPFQPGFRQPPPGGGPTEFEYFRLRYTANNGHASLTLLAELEIFDGATAWPTSAMTSNNAPSPFSATESAFDTNPAWKAFNKVKTGSDQYWNSGTTAAAEITLHVGAGNGFKPTTIELTASDVGAGVTSMIKDFTFDGSNVGHSGPWTNIFSITNETGWTTGELRSYNVATNITVVSSNTQNTAVGAGNPKTISGMSFGAAASNRDLIICLSGNRGAGNLDDVTSLTLAGNAATKIVNVAHTGGGWSGHSAIWSIPAGTGDALDGVTSGDVVITGAAIGIWICTIYNITGLNSLTAHDTDTGIGDDPSGAGVDCKANGIIIGIATGLYTGSDGSTGNFTNLANEDNDSTLDSNQVSSLVGHEIFSLSQTNRVVTGNLDTVAEGGSIALASFDSNTPTWETVWTATLGSNTDADNVSFRQVIPNIPKNAKKIRITVEAHSAATSACDNVAVGIRDGATDDCTAVPTEILFGGASGYSLAAGATLVSDTTNFTASSGDDLLVVFDMAGTNGNVRFTDTGSDGNYFQTNVNTYNTTTMAGTLVANRALNLIKVELFG